MSDDCNISHGPRCRRETTYTSSTARGTRGVRVGHAVPRLARRTTRRIDKWRTPLLAAARVGGKLVAPHRPSERSSRRVTRAEILPLSHTRLRKSHSSCTKCIGTFSTRLLSDYKCLSHFLLPVPNGLRCLLSSDGYWFRREREIIKRYYKKLYERKIKNIFRLHCVFQSCD